jgi:hypothetical protein
MFIASEFSNRSVLGYFLFLFNIRFSNNTCIIILFSSFNVDGEKKRKIDNECCVFDEEWGVKYLFIQPNSKDKNVCLTCKDTVAELKEYNIHRHYDTMHASTFSQFKEKQRSDKFESLRRCLR